MAKPLFLAGLVVWLLSIVTFLYCLFVILFAAVRSGGAGVAKTYANNPEYHTGGGRLGIFAASSAFQHPHKALILNGLRISALLVLVLGIAGGIAASQMRKARRQQAAQQQTGN